MSSSQITSLKVEIEFVPGTWTPVSQWVDWSAGASLTVGRNTQFDQPAPSTFSCTLDNTDGRFSPLQQNLRDVTGAGAVTPHPYWPNVAPRRRLRYSWVIGTHTYPQFVGYVRGWPPAYKNQRGPRVTITAVDRLARLDRVTMSTALDRAVKASNPAYYWPLTDDGGVTSATESSAQASLSLVGDAAAPLSFGESGPGSGNGSGVQFSPSAAGVGQVLNTQRLALPTAGGFSLELWLNPGTSPPAWSGASGENVFELRGRSGDTDLFAFVNFAGGTFELYFQNTGDASGDVVTGTSNLFSGGKYHHIVITVSSAGLLRLYVDGTQQASKSFGAGFNDALLNDLTLGESTAYRTPGSGLRYRGLMGEVALHARPLSAVEITDHYTAGLDYPNEAVDDRVARFLSYAGLTSADYLLDPSSVLLSSYGQDGQSVLKGAQDMLVTEGGAALIYVRYDGKIRMLNRDARLSPTPDLVISASGDLSGDVYAPAFDDDNLINQVVANRATASNSAASTQTVSAQDSIDEHELTNEDLTSYAQSDSDVLYNAQQRVAVQAYPTFRMQQVALDLYNAQTAGVGTAAAAMELSSRLRVADLDRSAAPTSSVDLFVEGFADAIGDSSYVRIFDTTAADSPAPAIADDADYGLAGTQDQTLVGDVDQLATTLTISTGSSMNVEPMFSTVTGDYPLVVLIGQEQIQLPAPPDSVPTLQVFHGALRGFNGTAAAAQPDGSAVELSPMATATL